MHNINALSYAQRVTMIISSILCFKISGVEIQDRLECKVGISDKE